MKTIVRFSAVLLAVIMAVCAMALVSAAYTDVDSKTVHVDAIEALSSLEILGGYEDGSFKPDDPVQRDEMAKMIYIMATTFTDPGEGVISFPDISEKHWAKGFISWCHSKSIVGGYEDGTFRPDDNITYDEALKMACAMLGYNDFNPDMWPADVRTIAISQLGLNFGIDETITGDTHITRSQACQILYNAFFKTMKSTQKVFEGETDGAGNILELPVDVAMTLAEDVWHCEFKTFQIVGTENFAVELLKVNNAPIGVDGKRTLSSTSRIYKTVKTESKTLVWVVDGDNNTQQVDVVEDLLLDEYKGKTDDLLFFKYSLVYKDGEQVGVPSVVGSKTENLSVSVSSTSSRQPDTADQGSSVFYYRNRITLDGIVHDGEIFENLRIAILGKTDGLFTIYDVEPDHVTDTDPDDTDYHLTTDARATLYSYVPYVGGGFATHTGWDTNGDGFYDIVQKEHPQAVEVTNVANNSGVLTLTYKLLYSGGRFYSGDEGGLSYTIPMEDVVSLRELKKGDIFIGYRLSDAKLKVMTIADPVTAKATAWEGSSLTLQNIGKVSAVGGAYFIGSSVPSDVLPLTDAVERYLTADPRTRSVPEYDYWLYGTRVLKTSATVPETETEYNKAILLYVDEKPEVQLDKDANKFVQFYPAYLLINGKEEAVNLNPLSAINNASGDYVSADNSPYRASVNEDQTLNCVYMPVTYTVDLDGYYSLYTTSEDIFDDMGTPNNPADDVVLEKVISASANPKLSYNETTGLYKLTTDNETISRLTVDEDTFLYYTYVKPSTGSYKYISFYTLESLPTSKFEEIAFVGDVYLAYDKETKFYTLKLGLLAGEFDTDVPETGTVIDYNEDGRVIYMALQNSSVVTYEQKAHYEHTFYNFVTGETFTALNKDKSITANANDTVAGYFYAWDETEGDYVEVFATGEGSADSLVAYTVKSVIENLRIVFTNEGEYVEGIKLGEDFKLFAFDDNLKMYEISFSDLADFFEVYEEKSEAYRMVFVTYEDENGDVIDAYAFVDWANVAKKELHKKSVGFIWE